MKVRKSDLGPMVKMAEGGFGCVYDVPRFKLPDDDTSLAYKEFIGDAATRKQSVESAKRAARFRAEEISAAERVVLDRYFTWPRELVVDDNDDVSGFLMPLIPGPFFFQHEDVKSGLMEARTRNLDWLIAPEARRKAAKISQEEIRESDRLFLVAQLVYAVAWLHRRGWVFGDVSFNNAAFTLKPPELRLFDCDGAAALADLDRVQPHTPFWRPPEFEEQQKKQDDVTDVYKLGLAIVRCLKSGKGAAQTKNVNRIKGIVDAEGLALVSRALGDRADRPSARDLYLYLEEYTQPLLMPPTVTKLALETPLLLRGAEVRISWQLGKGAEDIQILIGEQRTVVATVKATDHPRGYAFRATESGRVTVVVTNPYGKVTAEAGDLMVYEIPPFDVTLDKMPVPSVPPVPAFSLEPLAQLIPARPGLPPIPALPSAAPYDLIDHLAGEQWLVPPAKRIDETVSSGADAVTDILHGKSRRFVAGLWDVIWGKHDDDH